LRQIIDNDNSSSLSQSMTATEVAGVRSNMGSLRSSGRELRRVRATRTSSLTTLLRILISLVFSLMDRSMIGRAQLMMICRRVERSLQRIGFVLHDVQFDEMAQTLRITLDKPTGWQSASSAQAARANEKTIDARLLWEVLRDLNKLGVANPAIQLQPRERNYTQALEPPGGDRSSRFAGKFRVSAGGRGLSKKR
jgi:hypothetical protein